MNVGTEVRRFPRFDCGIGVLLPFGPQVVPDGNDVRRRLADRQSGQERRYPLLLLDDVADEVFDVPVGVGRGCVPVLDRSES